MGGRSPGAAATRPSWVSRWLKERRRGGRKRVRLGSGELEEGVCDGQHREPIRRREAEEEVESKEVRLDAQSAWNGLDPKQGPAARGGELELGVGEVGGAPLPRY